MGATTMPTTQLVARLKSDYPDVTFIRSDVFEWHPTDASITYDPRDSLFAGRLLHEVAHATLDHRSYTRDIELVTIERDAWQYARQTLAPRYGIEISSDEAEDDLDSYRDWMHSRSLCPSCDAQGIETAKQTYSCPTCLSKWSVNEARTCALRRYNT